MAQRPIRHFITFPSFWHSRPGPISHRTRSLPFLGRYLIWTCLSSIADGMRSSQLAAARCAIPGPIDFLYFATGYGVWTPNMPSPTTVQIPKAVSLSETKRGMVGRFDREFVSLSSSAACRPIIHAQRQLNGARSERLKIRRVHVECCRGWARFDVYALTFPRRVCLG